MGKYIKAYMLKNRDRILKRRREQRAAIKLGLEPPYKRKTRIKNPIDRVDRVLKSNIIGRTREAFKKNGHVLTSGDIFKIVGGAVPEIKRWVEGQFTVGMSWENYCGSRVGIATRWQLDHKIPFGSASTFEETRDISHYTNLQPMWAVENAAKGKKLSMRAQTN